MSPKKNSENSEKPRFYGQNKKKILAPYPSALG
jgi:hypothetical protein